MKDLYRIISGTNIIHLNGLTLEVRPFSVIDRCLSEIEYQKTYDDCFMNGFYTHEETLEMIGWGLDQEKALNDIYPKIEQMKLDYFNRFIYAKDKERIKKAIQEQEDRAMDLMKMKNQLFDKTCEFTAAQNMQLFLITRSTYLNGNLFNFENVNPLSVLSKYSETTLNEKELREVAKSGRWKALWSSVRDVTKIFVNHPSTYTEEQIGLAIWSKTYDSVHESMDCPSDAIINDDIAIDGWFIYQKRKREDDKKENSTKYGKADEVFVPAKNKEDLKAIFQMNSQKAQSKLATMKSEFNV